MWRLKIPSRFYRFLRPKHLAIYESCLIGLVAALAGVLLKQGTGWLGGWRVYVSNELPAWLVLPTIGLLGGMLTGFLIERLAPEAAGSGIPQVKAALGQAPIALNLRVALVKLVTTIVALGSGLSLGRQGPTVQVGAALASQLSQWIPTSPGYRRQLIAAGAAAGLAAGFNAPIAGVLFVVEELLQDFSGITLGSAILASFIGAVVSRLLGGQDLNLSLGTSRSSLFLTEIPWFLLLGILAGVLGALFNRSILTSLTLNRRLSKRLGLPLRIGLSGWISGLVVSLLPDVLRDNAGLQDLLVTGEAGFLFTAIAFVVKFGLTLIAYGSGCPGGLFAPSLILGSALGYLLSTYIQYLHSFTDESTLNFLTIGTTSTYALTGMGAFFSAVTRGPITAIVIVFEITADFNLVLPLMIGSVTAYLVAETVFSGSIYQHLLALNGIQIEPEAPLTGKLADLKASDIMQRRVETLTSEMTLEEVKQAFSRSHHRGFPVVDDGKLTGIVTQSDLAMLQLPGETRLQEIATPQPVTVSPEDSLSHVLYLLNRFKISRLPVTEGRKLVGIITRADIIRAESDQLSGQSSPQGPQAAPSYLVFQTRDPATGRGRLLLPLSNPTTAISLFKLAMAIAQDRHYEIECLQVILVPRTHAPSETPVQIATSQRLLDQVRLMGQKQRVPVHTQIRVAHEVSQPILEIIKERHIDLVVMGWKGGPRTPGRIFGGTVDTLIRQAACDVMVVKFQAHRTMNRWLVPLAGGPNAQYAIQLLPALISLGTQPEIRLCQVHQPAEAEPNLAPLQEATQYLEGRLDASVISNAVCANSVPEAIVDLSEKNQCDVIVLGASREKLLQQALKGNIPEAIVRQCHCTVILVRRTITEDP